MYDKSELGISFAIVVVHIIATADWLRLSQKDPFYI